LVGREIEPLQLLADRRTLPESSSRILPRDEAQVFHLGIILGRRIAGLTS